MTNLAEVEINNHPTHGTFTVKVPDTFDTAQTKSYVNTLDLDLILGVPNQDSTIGEHDVEALKRFENSSGSGKKDDKWFTIASLEGGTDTIGYGSKLTNEEAISGKMKIGDELVNYTTGITEEQALARFGQDVEWAKSEIYKMAEWIDWAQPELKKLSEVETLFLNHGPNALAKVILPEDSDGGEAGGGDDPFGKRINFS